MTPNPGGDLVSLLARHPFCDHNLLLSVFGRERLALLRARAGHALRTVSVAGSGVCYALAGEPAATLTGLRRLERARAWAVSTLGPQALQGGLSPGRHADLELLWQDRWWRFWVDPGRCAVTAAGFLHGPPPPAAMASDVVLAAERSRIAPIAAELQRRWGSRRVRVLHPQSGVDRTVTCTAHPGGRSDGHPPGPREVADCIDRRQRPARRAQRLGTLAAGLAPGDWTLLSMVGDLPLLTRYELAYTLSDRLVRVRGALDRLRDLENRGLLGTARSPQARDQLEERKVLTPRGLELLAAHWGSAPGDLVTRQPWPLAWTGRQLTYSLRWLELFGDHYRLVRQAALALLYGGRCVSHGTGGVRVTLHTTIAGCFRRHRTRSHPAVRVQPDAVLTAALYRRGWLEGRRTRGERPGPSATLLLELDRGTMSRGRLAEKLDRYRALWPGLPRPQLLWIVVGSPHREAWLVRAMCARGLDGWVARHQLLVLAPEHAWWLRHPPAALDQQGMRVGLPHASLGGLAPWRPVWSGTAGNGTGPLLGAQPWADRQRCPTE